VEKTSLYIFILAIAASPAYAAKPTPNSNSDLFEATNDVATTQTGDLVAFDGVDSLFVTGDNSYACIDNKFVKEVNYNGEPVALEQVTLNDGSTANCIVGLEKLVGTLHLKDKKTNPKGKGKEGTTYQVPVIEARAGVTITQNGQTCSVEDELGKTYTNTTVDYAHDLPEGITGQVVDKVLPNGSFETVEMPYTFDALCRDGYTLDFRAEVSTQGQDIDLETTTYDPQEAQLKVYGADRNGLVVRDLDNDGVFDTIIGARARCFDYIQPTNVQFLREPEGPGQYIINVSEPDVFYDDNTGEISWLPDCFEKGQFREVEVSYRTFEGEVSPKKTLIMQAN
jgi:hypothetical protein